LPPELTTGTSALRPGQSPGSEPAPGHDARRGTWPGPGEESSLSLWHRPRLGEALPRTHSAGSVGAVGLPARAGRLRRWCLPAIAATVAAMSFAAALTIATPAGAEEVFTGQAAAAHATDSTWIPAPATRAAVCIVDTGNDINPDTSNVVARFSVDGGSGADLHHDHHGTLMSMITSAPLNGFGMVGAAPSINVVSVRASRDGSTFGSDDLTKAIQMCSNKRSTYNIKVVLLSLGGQVATGLDAASMAVTENAVDNATRNGLAVVAAAGNHPGTVDWPAGYAPVFAVGASDNDGAPCAFASSGPGLDLWAPGCPQDVALPDGSAAWANGSSEAAAFVAGVLTELRAIEPLLSVAAAEGVLAENARRGAASRMLDVDAAFRAAGHADELAAGAAAIPYQSTPALTEQGGAPGTSIPNDAGAGEVPRTPPIAPVASTLRDLPRLGSTIRASRLVAPKVRSWRLRHGILTLALMNRPSGVEAQIALRTRKEGRAFPRIERVLTVRNDRLRTRVSRTLTELSITYRDPARIRRTSTVVRLHPRS
jgi:hypothetical protein